MKMKTLFALIMVAVLAILTVPITHAADPVYAAQTITATNIPAGATATQPLLIDCRKQQNVALSWTTGSTNLAVQLDASVDGVNYASNWKTLSLGSGTTVTNLNVAGIGYLRSTSQVNTGTIIATNTISYGIKLNAP